MGTGASKLTRVIGVGRIRGGRLRIGAPRAPKGYVPFCVGLGDDSKTFMIHTSSLGDADFMKLLCISAEEYGFGNQGVLRIPYDTKSFEEWMLVKHGQRMLKVVTAYPPQSY